MNANEVALCVSVLDHIEENLDAGEGWLDSIRQAERTLQGLPHTGPAHLLLDSLADAEVIDTRGMLRDTRALVINTYRPTA